MSAPLPNVQTVPWFGTKSQNTRQVVFVAFDNPAETLTLPLLVSTKVLEVRHMLASKLGVNWESFTFVQKGAGKTRTLRDSEEIRTTTIVKGIRSFTREKQRWPHPVAIIGAGHSGLRQAMSFLKEGITNFEVFDRHSEVGGTAWVLNANPTSKLQTELAVYHLQYDPDYPPPTSLKTQPSARELIDHFRGVSEEYGIMPHVCLNSDVTACDVVKDEKDPSGFSQTYHLTIESLPGHQRAGEERILECSGYAIYPGGLITPKRVDYKGEDIFEGQIGYGMFNEFDYSRVKGDKVAIIGFGAFATENVRTCVECRCDHVSIICRRRNLAMPRIVSWMTNQSLYPVPGKMCLDVMKKMFVLANEGGGNLDDPWTYYAVMTTEKRINATIRQDSRFGIGDVMFLACFYGKCNCVLGTVKRMKRDGLQLESGDTLEISHMIKVLGFVGDQTTDKVFGIKKMEGWHVNGDFRRFCWSENPGVDAGKFGGTSFSPAAISTSDLCSWILNYPADAFMVLGTGMLPTKKYDPEKVRPTYVWEPRSASQIGMLYGGIPGYAEKGLIYGPFNRERQLLMHPLGKFMDELEEEWKFYCDIFRELGDDRPCPPYPYTREEIQQFVDEQDREGEEDQARQNARMQSG